MEDVDLDVVDIEEGGTERDGSSGATADASSVVAAAAGASGGGGGAGIGGGPGVGGFAGPSGVLSPPTFEKVSQGARQRPPDGAASGDPMSGVGEDENPYNYICNLDKVNLGGPGWFNDVFKVSIEIHAERTWMDTLSLSLVPRHIFERHCALLDTALPVSGTITVEAPPSKKVWMAGLTVAFEEHLLTVDTDGGELVGALEAQVALAQTVEGKTTFGFSLDLGLLEGHRGWPVRETYVGDLMALRHRILVSAQRPWYTFNVYNQASLAMECLSNAPETDAGQDNEEGGPNHLLIISDCNGRCEFDFGVDSFHLDDELQGVVRFIGIAKPIVAAHVMFLRAEFMYGEASETLVAEHTILGTKRQRKNESTLAGAEQSVEEAVRAQQMSPFVDQRHIHFVHTQNEDCRMEPVVGDSELSLHIPLQALPLTTSHMSLTQDISLVKDEAELVGVRYYIRLILEDNSGAAYWHTHEIFFHRAKLSPSSVDVEGYGDSENDYGDRDDQEMEDDDHDDQEMEDDITEGTDYTHYSTTRHATLHLSPEYVDGPPQDQGSAIEAYSGEQVRGRATEGEPSIAAEAYPGESQRNGNKEEPSSSNGQNGQKPDVER